MYQNGASVRRASTQSAVCTRTCRGWIRRRYGTPHDDRADRDPGPHARPASLRTRSTHRTRQTEANRRRHAGARTGNVGAPQYPACRPARCTRPPHSLSHQGNQRDTPPACRRPPGANALSVPQRMATTVRNSTEYGRHHRTRHRLRNQSHECGPRPHSPGGTPGGLYTLPSGQSLWILLRPGDVQTVSTAHRDRC